MRLTIRLQAKFIFFIILLVGCMDVPRGVEESLLLARENGGELKKVLRHYHRNRGDSLKFQAACFLIENMKWHATLQHVDSIDLQFEWINRMADSAYNVLWKEKAGKLDSLPFFKTLLQERFKWLADSVRKCRFHKSKVEKGFFPDLQNINSDFLIGHIDNAFRQWKISPFARRLTFDEFCEYILPYRSLRGYASLYSGKELAQRYEVYVNHDSTESMAQRVLRYNNRITAVRNLLGWRKIKDFGIYNLDFRGHDCIDMSVYACSILRACGIPVMMEFCDAFRDLPGRHYFCAALDSTNEWQVFNPETRVPGDYKWRMGATMNVYRWYYGAQKNTPYFLKNENEYIPQLFTNPCCQDVTADHFEVAEVRLPFTIKTQNRLVWLAAYQSRRSLAPVTWGEADTVRQEACYKRVMFGRLYFPMYYEGQVLTPFGEPFYIEKDTSARGYRVRTFGMSETETESVLLTRKYSRKPAMMKIAKELVGGQFWGGNRQDFSDGRLLYTITQPPMPCFQDYVLAYPVKYKYYRFVAPPKYPHAKVATVEYLTDKRYNYSNVMEPTSFSVLSPENRTDKGTDIRWVKLLDSSWEEMKRRPESDGNMQTAPSVCTLNFNLQQPQIVHRMRFAPQNADNGIRRGDTYELFYWQNGWKSIGVKIAEYEYLEFSYVPKGALLWLKNHTRGQEEMPFVMKDGRQLFLYPNIIR